MRPLYLPVALTAFLLADPSGCEQAKPEKPEKVKVIKQNRVPVHRFTITRDSNVAFDTQTGQICRTWEWEPKGKQQFSDDGSAIPRSFGEFAPTCLSVYQNYPSGTDVQSESVQEPPN